MKRPAIAAALLVFATTAAGARQSTPGPSQVFRSTVQLVPLNVTVLDAHQQFVEGLTADDFTVLEDGVKQQVQFFETADVPLDLILLVDTSSSMAQNMAIVHEAAVGFLSTLRPGDRGALVAFADRVNVVQALTEDRQALEKAVRQTTARGATALNDAIYISLKQFGQRARQEGEIRRQAIALLTDGEDTSSLLNAEDVIEIVRQSGVSIYPITLRANNGTDRPVAESLRRTGTQMQAQYSLRQLARETGARAFLTVQLPGLKDVYSMIAEELSSQYSIAYAPRDTAADGRFRRIAVQVASRPELRLRTRLGYIVAIGGRADLGLRPEHSFAAQGN